MPKCVPEVGVRVLRVRPGSPAAGAGLRAGDRVVRVNGRALRDLIDFHLQAAEPRLRVEVERDGGTVAVVLDRAPGRDLGIECEPPKPAEISTCANKCVFCFIHQLPRGLRKSLYVKDDDYRLSFLHGNYITLTDLPESEIQRILEQRLSPLYISVHATDPDLRRFLLGNPKTLQGDLLERMGRLARGGIRMHAQVVLCPGHNDGPQLERTVRDLAALHPGVATVAVVPVGLTRHREGLFPLRPVTPEEARAVLEAVHAWQAEFLGRLGTRLVFAADELYLLAGAPIPPAAAYEGYPVVEDGVGLVRRFQDDFVRIARRRPGRPGGPRRVTVATGELFAPVLRDLLETLEVPGLGVDVVAVPNEFFGRSISVAGLLTGQDIARALTGRALGERVLVPDVALQETGGVFLDDLTPADLARHLGVAVVATPATAAGLLRALLPMAARPGR